jgi:hypothetical protein
MTQLLVDCIKYRRICSNTRCLRLKGESSNERDNLKNEMTPRYIYNMKKHYLLIICLLALSACTPSHEGDTSATNKTKLSGTWRLLEASLIEKGDTTVTRYGDQISFIKIINDTHFAFLQHDLAKGKNKDSVFVAGGGKYTLADSLYTEHLEYCSAREWEGNDFPFKITIRNDTLIQTGVEKVADLGIERINTEKYVRVSP